MRQIEAAGLGEIDWSRPWLAPWRERGEPLARRAIDAGVAAALNADERRADVALAAGRLHFVAHADLPSGEAYETFIARRGAVPTRDNLHDFFNGLVWLAQPRLKRRLNELQADQLTLAPVPGARGAVRDALTVFDENAATWQAPARLVDALRRRDWQALFVTHRRAWSDACLTLFGHALMEKLVRPRKAITAHVWAIPERADPQTFLLDALEPEALAARVPALRPLPLPVLGVPGWWPANDDAAFYRDAAVFRPA